MEDYLRLSFDALEDAEKRIGSYEPDNRFAPMAETLLWIDLINTAFWSGPGSDRYVEIRQADDAGKTIEGLRYARNRLTHDPMSYGPHDVQYEGGAFDSAAFDRGFDTGEPIWRWRHVHGDLPPYDKDKTIEAVYREHLEGRAQRPKLDFDR